MSDLAAAAAALGLPEALVQRSAAARATETGMTVEEVLAAWGGGGTVPTPSPLATAAPAAPAQDAAAEKAEPAAAAIESPAISLPAPPTGPITYADAKPPVLVVAPDKPMRVLVASIGLFVAILLVGLVGPSLSVSTPGARSSNIAYSAPGIAGQAVYRSVGCGSCHTQMVRPVISDVGLGAVSLNDTNQVLGTRRYGPDLSDIGSRKSGSELEAIIGGFAGHGRSNLSPTDIDNLVAYLVESSTTVPG